MTREEYDEFMFGVCSSQEDIDVKQKYIDSLEQQNKALTDRIKEMGEPKTCDGCEHYDKKQGLRFCSLGWECKRGAFDKYTPKQNQSGKGQ